MKSVDLNPVRARWLVEGVESDIGLWWLADDIREVVGRDTDEEEIRRLTLLALKPLLEAQQLQVVQLFEDGSYEPWSGSADTQLRRIETEWRGLGRMPQIGDVAWFIVPVQ